MILKLVGHEYKYAVEQIMLALFPKERPEYPSKAGATVDPISGSGDLLAESHLRTGKTYAQATTVIHSDCKAFRGTARVSRVKLTDDLTADRLLQRIIKQSFYRAALGIIDTPPVWGSLTGIRPAHIAAAAFESGRTEKAVITSLIRDYYVSPERAALCADAAQASVWLKRTISPRDAALYIGIPFCPTRCAYCSFVSNSVEKSFALVEPFVKTLLREIEAVAKVVKELDLSIIALYVGGGTPTSLPEEALEAIMLALSSAFDLSDLREYTFEAGRPDTISAAKLETIRRRGAGRVCVNPQSMSTGVLEAIGRRHTPEEVLGAVRLVREKGMALNMDIIAGLPRDTRDGFADSLNAVMDLAPENITVHTLALKKGSRIMLEETRIPGGPEVAGMLGYASACLRDGGYDPYYLYRQKYTSGGFENTGWTRPGFEGIYNICMMEELCTVLSFGGGGVTKLVSPDGGRIERVFNAKYPREYIQNTDSAEEKVKKIRAFYSGLSV